MACRFASRQCLISTTAALGNPLFLIKARMQAHVSATAIKRWLIFFVGIFSRTSCRHTAPLQEFLSCTFNNMENRKGSRSVSWSRWCNFSYCHWFIRAITHLQLDEKSPCLQWNSTCKQCVDIFSQQFCLGCLCCTFVRGFTFSYRSHSHCSVL